MALRLRVISDHRHRLGDKSTFVFGVSGGSIGRSAENDWVSMAVVSDGSYGVDKCPEGHPDAGKWKCYWMGLGWMYDISAAPTTYAMSYRPYEVEDQDNLQRAHVAEYLVADAPYRVRKADTT